MKIWPLRYAVKIFFLLLFNTVILNLLFNQAFPSYFAPLPVLVPLNSVNTPSVGVFDILQLAFTHSVFPLTAIASILIIGSLFGRLFCGWACPMGFIQELITNIRGGGINISLTTHQFGIKIKYLILVITLAVSVSLGVSYDSLIGYGYREALGAFAEGPFLVISPDGTLFGTIPHLLQRLASQEIPDLTMLLIAKFLFLGVFFAGAFSIPWFFCRYLCPMGALMGIFSRFSLLGMKRSPIRCVKCPFCIRNCPMQVRILDLPWVKFNDPECTLCLECVEACPNGALSPKFP